MALGCCDPALLLQLAPRHIVFLWTNEAKDIGLAPVFTDERCCQTKAPASLNFCCDAEDRGWQQVHFVVDNQTPIVAGEEREMWVRLLFCAVFVFNRAAIGENLVGTHCDRADILAVSRIFADHLWRKVCLVENFANPLANRNGIWSQNEGCALDVCHCCQPDNCFTGTTW